MENTDPFNVYLSNMPENMLKQRRWNAQTDDVVDLFNHLFKNSFQSKIGVGYFSTNWVRLHAKGIAFFAKHKGQAEWLLAPKFQPNDPILDFYDDSSTEKKEKLTCKVLEQNIDDLITTFEDKDQVMPAIAALIKNEQLKISVAVPKEGRKHIHIKHYFFEDEYDQKIFISGSANATSPGFVENFDTLTLFTNIPASDDPNDILIAKRNEEEYLEPLKMELLKLLDNGNEGNYEVVPLPEAIKKNLVEKIEQNFNDTKNDDGDDLDAEDNQCMIRIPDQYKGKGGFEQIQKIALSKAQEKDYKLTLAMATGTGKTIASLKIFANFVQNNLDRQVILFVACPSDILINQWEEVVAEFGITPKVYEDNKQDTRKKIKEDLRAFEAGFPSLLEVLILDNRSLQDTDIKDRIKHLSQKYEVFLIIDEIHNLFSPGFSSIKVDFLDEIKYVVGLTATPEKRFKKNQENPDEGDIDVSSLLGPDSLVEIVNLHDAIYKYKVLCEYKYTYIRFKLTHEESQRIFELWELAQRSFYYNPDPKDKKKSTAPFSLSREINGAASKMVEVIKFLNDETNIKGLKESKILFYIDLKHLEQLTQTLHKKGFNVMRITYNETDKGFSKDRSKILEQFKDGNIDCLVAYTILDEGINIPNIDVAFFTSSYLEPRQGIQRRGRILRTTHDNTKYAQIYDFIAEVPTDFKPSDKKKLIKKDKFIKYITNRENERVVSFKKDAKEFKEIIVP